MRRVAVAGIGVLGLVVVVVTSAGAAQAPAAVRESPASARMAIRPTSAGARLRILYAADWTGSMQIFAADPSGRAPLAQVTFARPSGACQSPTACGFMRPLPSPDGRWLVYWSDAPGPFAQPLTMWLAHANGSGPHPMGRAFDAAWAPDSRRLAYSAPDGIHVLATTRAGRTVDHRENVRIVGGQSVGRVTWSPDGRGLAFVDSRGLVLARGGREHVVARTVSNSFAWSRDGRQIAYGTSDGIFLIATKDGRPRLVYRPQPSDQPWRPLELAFAPNGRRLAFAFGGAIRIVDTRSLRITALRAAGHDLAWSPDGRSLLYVQGSLSAEGDSITTGDVQAVTPNGRIRTVVSASKPYGGQIVSAAWTKSPPDVHYRRPQRLDGVFAGGPVQEIAADGGRVAFIACGGVWVWTPATGAVDSVERAPDCRASFSRGHVYSLGLAGDRLAWIEKGWGLCFYWDAREATLGAPPLELATGNGCLGSPPSDGIGTVIGAGSLLVLSHWQLHYDNGASIVGEQAIERVDAGGCPCPVLSSSPGPYTPLDVDAGRIVVSGQNETRVLAGDGTILLSLPAATLAAQLSSSDLVLAAGGELRIYNVDSGNLRGSWPLPAQPAGHDCDLFGDPSCNPSTRLTLGDVGHGLAAYVVDGRVHVLRLADGVDKTLGPGTLARFTDSGLVYADGARIRLVPYARLLVR